MTELDIACSADGRYVRHCAAMIHSVLARSREDTVRVHFLHGPELAAPVADALRQMVQHEGGTIAFHTVDDRRVDTLPRFGRWTAAIWFRLFLPELLPDHDRVLYLDADTLAVGSPAALFELDMDGFHIGAVTNVPERHLIGRAVELGLPDAASYFNSGVLLMNLELMRSDDITDKLCGYASGRGRSLLWPDQDTLNVNLAATRLPLHPRWNRMHSLDFAWAGELVDPEELAEARAEPGILHFEGPADNKPWHLLSDPAARALYTRHRRATPWPRYRLEGSTPLGLARWAARGVGGRVRP